MPTNSRQTLRDQPAVVGLRVVWQGLRQDCDFARSAKARFRFGVSSPAMKRPFAILLGCLLMGSVAFAFEMVNDKCPVDGKNVRLIYRLNTPKGWIAFCCIDCQENFKARPTAYKVLPKEKAK
jgi:hypothetical protein